MTLAPPRAHRDDPATSHAAAASNTTSETHQDMILQAHLDRLSVDPRYTGLTDEQAGQLAGLETVEARRRSNNLRDVGMLRFTGEERPGIRYPNKANGVSVITDTGLDRLGVPR